MPDPIDRLRAATTACPVCNGNPNPEPDPGFDGGPCSICKGSGTVPLIPGLREPCERRHGYEAEFILREWLVEHGYHWSLRSPSAASVWSEEREPDGATCWDAEDLCTAAAKALGLEVEA